MSNVGEKGRLLWHCRRGMLELDLIFKDFIENKMEHLSKEQVESFDALLSNTDPELFAWFMGHEEPPQRELREIVSIIRNNN